MCNVKESSTLLFGRQGEGHRIIIISAHIPEQRFWRAQSPTIPLCLVCAKNCARKVNTQVLHKEEAILSIYIIYIFQHVRRKYIDTKI